MSRREATKQAFKLTDDILADSDRLQPHVRPLLAAAGGTPATIGPQLQAALTPELTRAEHEASNVKKPSKHESHAVEASG